MKDLPFYTQSQLSLRNGQDHEKVWVCINEVIYDVTNSKMWKGGRHYEHWAGQELDNEITEAPHTKEIVNRFEPIGILKK